VTESDRKSDQSWPHRLLFEDELPAAELLLLLGDDGQLFRGAQAKVLPQNAHKGHLPQPHKTHIRIIP
jgi:hypothetical protein